MFGRTGAPKKGGPRRRIVGRQLSNAESRFSTLNSDNSSNIASSSHVSTECFCTVMSEIYVRAGPPHFYRTGPDRVKIRPSTKPTVLHTWDIDYCRRPATVRRAWATEIGRVRETEKNNYRRRPRACAIGRWHCRVCPAKSRCCGQPRSNDRRTEFWLPVYKESLRQGKI